jgi:hypothetical protein
LEQRLLIDRGLDDLGRLRLVQLVDVDRDAAVDRVERLGATVIGDGLRNVDGVVTVLDGDVF